MMIQAEDIEKGRTRTLEELRILRRNDIVLHSMYFPYEMGLNIPDEVFYHPIVEEIGNLVADLATFDNVSPFVPRILRKKG
jgi:hypothetical protein